MDVLLLVLLKKSSSHSTNSGIKQNSRITEASHKIHISPDEYVLSSPLDKLHENL